MIDSLFVYGTLAPGEPNAEVLAGIHGSWRPACVRGTLRDAGWAAEFGYPGIELTDTENEVKGMLLTSVELQQHWDRLVEFEGSAYRRVEVTARCENGELVQAYIYEIAVP
ncbi:MAG: gamma-glutamylcyclotransferase [Pseudohongiella sp.]|nr:MAG: gamma-glutamylcyclotransferase [Pseudohongiella sp.]